MTDELTELRKVREAERKEIERELEESGLQPDSEAWNRRLDLEMERRREYHATAVRVKKAWMKAKPASPDHPYLERKGVTDPDGIKQDGDTLLVPMKALENKEIMNVQRIAADGSKLFGKGGRASRVYLSIGAKGFKRDGGTLYIAEGYATGWTIHHVTGEAVAVAFSANNVAHVADAMRRKYPQAHIVIAADNDRWKGEFNTGVERSRDAAAQTQSLVAIPDFEKLESQPTDFNDLYLLEGPAAVKRWLDPGVASRARTTNGAAPAPAPVPEPPPMDDGPELEPTPEDERGPDVEPPADEDDGGGWQKSARFRCLGYDRGTYYYLPRGTGQIVELTAVQHDRKSMLPLAEASWWASHFPGKQTGGVDWHNAADALLRTNHRLGVFRHEHLRGRGCAVEGRGAEREVLLHLGDRLLPEGATQWLEPENYESPYGYIYERLQRIDGPSDKRAMTLDGAGRVLTLFEDLLWYDAASGPLLAGWTVLAPVCGALSWRPHVWVTGERGCGKSTILESLLVPLLGGMAWQFEGNTTEAGIRQKLRSDALPVLFDEAERQDARSDSRIQSVLALARSASSMEGGHVAKGTTHGTAMSFAVRSMFCLASIGGAVRQEADKSRIALLQLQGQAAVAPEERRAHWARYRPRLADVSVDMGRELIARTMRWLRDGRLDATLETMRTQAAVVLEDQRSGDQYGTLLAGAWTLMSDEPPADEEARELVATHDLGRYLSEQAPEGIKVIRTILQQDARVDTSNGPKTVAVGELVDICMSTAPSADKEASERWLRMHGIRTDVDNGERVLELANTSEWIRSVLQETPYADAWTMQLRTLPGVRAGSPKRFHAGLRSRVVIIPQGTYD